MRSMLCRRFSKASSASDALGIEMVPERITQEIAAEHDAGDREPGDERYIDAASCRNPRYRTADSGRRRLLAAR